MSQQNTSKKEKIFHGIPASPGIAIGKIFSIGGNVLEVEPRTIEESEIESELKRYHEALKKAKSELDGLVKKAKRSFSEESAKIFQVHQTMLADPMVIEGTEQGIQNARKSADHAFKDVMDRFEASVSKMEDEYFRARAADLYDLKCRVIRHIQGHHPVYFNRLTEPAIIFAKELTPSDTISLETDKVLGFAMDFGGRTSHATIVARSMNVPAVVALHDAGESISNGDQAIIDGNAGRLILNPGSKTQKLYEKRLEDYHKFERKLEQVRSLPARTKDGKDIEVASNIEFPSEVDSVIENGGNGIGLYRTEYLFLADRQLPSEDYQYREYKKITKKLNGQPLIIRTFDLGGDKPPQTIDLPAEKNPFLGLRGARLYNDIGKKLFKTQLKAILRASAHGNIMLMFPMISCIPELRYCIQTANEVKQELIEKNIKVADHIPIGVMIEVPSSAVIADLLARECDFLSIGTNDLVQYTLAVDRGNENISYMYQPFNPAVLRLIHDIIKKGHEEGAWVGMCGEMASDPLATMILVGLGLDEFSVSPGSLLAVKDIIRRVDFSECSNLAEKAMNFSTGHETREYLQMVFSKKFHDLMFINMAETD